MKRTLLALFLSFQSLILAACTSASFFVANLPEYFSDIKQIQNVSYGDAAHQKLDIYVPQVEGDQTFPVIVFFHGGRWTDGNKDQYSFVAMTLAKYGFVVVVPDYAKYPKVKFPVFIEDSAKAVAWAHDNIGNFRGQAQNLFLSGHSSGAHMAALVATDPSYLKKYGKDRNIIRAFAGLAGPYDFEPEEPDLKDMFGPPSNYPQMQVSTFIDGKQPPMFLQHGKQDDVVYTTNITKVKKAAEEKGGDVTSKIYKSIDHVGIVAQFAWVKSSGSDVVQDMVTFFRQHVKEE